MNIFRSALNYLLPGQRFRDVRQDFSFDKSIVTSVWSTNNSQHRLPITTTYEASSQNLPIHAAVTEYHVITGLDMNVCQWGQISAIKAIEWTSIVDLVNKTNTPASRVRISYDFGVIGNADCNNGSSDAQMFRCKPGNCLFEIKAGTDSFLKGLAFGEAPVLSSDALTYTVFGSVDAIAGYAGWGHVFPETQPAPRMPVVGMIFSCNPDQHKGIIDLWKVLFRNLIPFTKQFTTDYALQLQCLNGKASSALCQINFDTNDTVAACSTNFPQACFDFCKASNDSGILTACDKAASAYCSKQSPDDVKNSQGLLGQTCGCHMPPNFYLAEATKFDKYVPEFSTHSGEPRCWFPQCNNGLALLTQSGKQNPPACPSLTACLQSVNLFANVVNNSSIDSSQVSKCMSGTSGNTPPASTTSPPTPTTSPGGGSNGSSSSTTSGSSSSGDYVPSKALDPVKHSNESDNEFVSNSSGLDKWQITLIVIGSLVVTLVIVLVMWYMWRRTK